MKDKGSASIKTICMKSKTTILTRYKLYFCFRYALIFLYMTFYNSLSLKVQIFSFRGVQRKSFGGATIGASKCNFPPFLEIMTDRLTNRSDRKGHREITLPTMDVQDMFLNAVQDPNIKNRSLNEFRIRKTVFYKYSNHFKNDIHAF